MSVCDRMHASDALPRILVIDDLYGREVDGVNRDRVALCVQLRLADETRPQAMDVGIGDPVARAVFCRGQLPTVATVGDVVENDLPGTLRVIDSGWHQRPAGTAPWALVLLDLRFRSGVVTRESESRFGRGMPEGRVDDESSPLFGMRLLAEMHTRYPHLPVVVLSDAPRETVIRQSSALGAVAFLAKGDASAADRLRDYLRRHALIADPSGEIIGTSIELLVALRDARRAALSDEPVLIRGETGTGKELLARYLHRNDPRRGASPLVIVDSGTLSAELYASELFGHMRGAFTGAISDRVGRIVEAHHGALFLDEIGNADSSVQRGLLRVLQEKQVRPVGGGKLRTVDVRFIFATNEDIESRAEAENGFRHDLLERMQQGGKVIVPPLRERLDDMPLLVEALIREAEKGTPGALRRQIEDDALQLVQQYPWPGNIRELRRCLIAAVNARPDVEHLVAVHLRLPAAALPLRKSAPPAPATPPTELGEVIAQLQRLDPAELPVGELIGRYVEFETAFARAAMKYLKACLHAVRKPTVRNPRGEVLVHPAVKLMLGEQRVTVSRAYDFIIRLRNLSPEVAEEWDADGVLAPLFERARAQRRAGRRSSPATDEMETSVLP